MTDLATFVLAAMTSLAPARDHTILATALVARIEAEPPLFAGDDDRVRTAALATAILFREGSLGLNVEGDKVRGVVTSWCSAQINLSPGAKTREGWTGPELRDDPDKCVAVEMRLLHSSVLACPAAPVSEYAVGPRACTSRRGIRISNDRMWLARKLIQDIAASGRKSSLFLDLNTERGLRACSSHAGAICLHEFAIGGTS